MRFALEAMAMVTAVAAALVGAPAWAAGRTAASAPMLVAGKATKPREPVRRTLTVNDANADAISDVHVERGVATTLSFPVAIKAQGVNLSDPNGRFFLPQVNDKMLLLMPKANLGKGEFAPLSVTLVDGTLVPFKLVTVDATVDSVVDVVIDLKNRAPPESLAALKDQLESVRAELDECKAGAAGAGIGKLAALLIAEDLSKPQAFLVERHSVHKMDKQSRMLVQTRMVYRLLDLSFLVLTVENRDVSRSWVLDKAKLSVGGGDVKQDVQVVTSLAETVTLAPDQEEKIVIAFRTPPQGSEHRYTLELLEKDGNRHVKLEDMNL